MPISVPGSRLGIHVTCGIHAIHAICGVSGIRHIRDSRDSRDIRGIRLGGMPRGRLARSGFTLLELLVVIAIVALSATIVALALPDSDAAQLEEEGARLAALLEMARADARASGIPVYFVPTPDTGAPDAAQFRFAGLPAQRKLPTRWLHEGVSAQIVGDTELVLGPDAILPAQRIVLRLADRRLELASDGLGPFAVATASAEP